MAPTCFAHGVASTSSADKKRERAMMRAKAMQGDSAREGDSHGADTRNHTAGANFGWRADEKRDDKDSTGPKPAVTPGSGEKRVAHNKIIERMPRHSKK